MHNSEAQGLISGQVISKGNDYANNLQIRKHTNAQIIQPNYHTKLRSCTRACTNSNCIDIIFLFCYKHDSQLNSIFFNFV